MVRPSGCWPDDFWMFADWQSNSPGKIAEAIQTLTRFEGLKGQEAGNVPDRRIRRERKS